MVWGVGLCGYADVTVWGCFGAGCSGKMDGWEATPHACTSIPKPYLAVLDHPKNTTPTYVYMHTPHRIAGTPYPHHTAPHMCIYIHIHPAVCTWQW